MGLTPMDWRELTNKKRERTKQRDELNEPQTQVQKAIQKRAEQNNLHVTQLSWLENLKL